MIEIFIKMWYNKETQPEVYIKKRLIGGMFSSAMLQYLHRGDRKHKGAKQL